jgi:integrase
MRGILAGFQSDKKARAVMALAFLGIRPAEILGLRWEDIQRDGINVQRGMWKGIITPGKTGSRFVPIGPMMWGILEEHRIATREMNVTGYVFENSIGKALNTDGLNALTARVIRPVLKTLGYEWKTLYAGRRGGVTEMRRHADPQTVAFIMGHSPEVENSNYLKAVEQDKRDVALLFDAALSANERQLRDRNEGSDAN